MALGLPREVATEHTQCFREHDERPLASQHLIYDDESALLESALLESAVRGRAELESLFEADVGERKEEEVATSR